MPVVRRLRAGEWRAWRDLRLAALRESPQAFGSTYELESVLSDREWRLRSGRLASARDRAMLVAEDGGRLVGSAGVFVDPEQEASILFAMWVAPERRGRGLGMALVEAARDLARSLEKPVLRLNVVEGNRAAISLYLRAGFVDTGRRVRMPRDPSLIEIEMELALV